MQRRFSWIFVLFISAITFSAIHAYAAPQSPRQEISADANWKFFLGDPAGAEAPPFSDAAWRDRGPAA